MNLLKAVPASPASLPTLLGAAKYPPGLKVSDVVIIVLLFRDLFEILFGFPALLPSPVSRYCLDTPLHG